RLLGADARRDRAVLPDAALTPGERPLTGGEHPPTFFQSAVTLPCIMSMPHAKASLPVCGMVTSMLTGWFSGSARLTLALGITTSVPQPSSLVRVKTRRTCSPAFACDSAG